MQSEQVAVDRGICTTRCGRIVRRGRDPDRARAAPCVEAPRQGKIGALVFVGDAMEENPDALCNLAGGLGLRGVPVFVFHEGSDAVAERTFREIARLRRAPIAVSKRQRAGVA